MSKEKSPEQPGTPGVYRAIAQVQAALAQQGLGKNSRNEAQRFNFRGIDDVMNVLSPLLAEAGLLILPVSVSREATERPSKSGGTLIHVAVAVGYDFVCVADGSKHALAMHGEAMDSGDKATSKALSMAYKTLCLEAFCIPVVGTPDADAETHEPAAKVVANADAPAHDGFPAGLHRHDAKLAGEGLCKPEELIAAVKSMGQARGYPADLRGWSGVQVAEARELARAFEAARRKQSA